MQRAKGKVGARLNRKAYKLDKMDYRTYLYIKFNHHIAYELTNGYGNDTNIEIYILIV